MATTILGVFGDAAAERRAMVTEGWNRIGEAGDRQGERRTPGESEEESAARRAR